MNDYETMRSHSKFGELEPLSQNDAEQLRVDFPGTPSDYVEFLVHVGAGSVGDSFCVYTGPLSPDAIYDAQAAKKLEGVVLVGDDFQGYCVGFDTEDNWALVEVDPISHETNLLEASFTEYVRKRYAR